MGSTVLQIVVVCVAKKDIVYLIGFITMTLLKYYKTKQSFCFCMKSVTELRQF